MTDSASPALQGHGPAAPAADHDNPFPGLRPFREDEEHLFFGREHQVDAMVDKLAGGRFLAVVGASGSGKSSLVNCGLRPALRLGLLSGAGNAWRMAQFRPGNRPIRAMAEALGQDGLLFAPLKPGGLTLPDMIETSLQMSRAGLQDVFQQARVEPGVNLLVVVDQFEELFRYRAFSAGREGRMSAAEEATAFVNLLLEAHAQRECPIYIVLTMRSDFLGDCTQFPGLAEAINAGQYLVPRLTRDERRAAIRGPIAVAGGKISSVLLNQLVNDVGDNPDQLSILQHALNRTWARWRSVTPAGAAASPIDLPHYEFIGTMARALDEHAERAFHEIPEGRPRALCEKAFRSLTDKATDPRGVRRPTTLAQLCAVTEGTEDELKSIIEVFRKPSRSFLMPPADEALRADSVIDISHESLMRVWKRLNTWAQAEALSVQTYRRLSDTAQLHAAGKASLWRDPDLAQARQWLEREAVNDAWAARYGKGLDQALAFLQASEQERDQALAVERLREEQQQQARERELAQAHELAEEQRRRADEQAAARQRQRKLNLIMAALSVVAVVTAVVAIRFQVRANELATRLEAVVQEGQRASDELAQLRLKIQQMSVAIAKEAPQASEAREAGTKEVAEATLDVLRSATAYARADPQVAVAAEKAEAYVRKRPAELSAIVTGAAVAEASRNLGTAAATTGVAAARPTAAGASPGAAPAPAATAVTAAAPSAAVPSHALPVARWSLASGGCLKGAVTVAGTAYFWLTSEGDSWVAHSWFEAKDGNGFVVTSKGASQPVAGVPGNKDFEIASDAQWRGPQNRVFASKAVERLSTGPDGKPREARLMSLRTLCTY